MEQVQNVSYQRTPWGTCPYCGANTIVRKGNLVRCEACGEIIRSYGVTLPEEKKEKLTVVDKNFIELNNRIVAFGSGFIGPDSLKKLVVGTVETVYIITIRYDKEKNAYYIHKKSIMGTTGLQKLVVADLDNDGIDDVITLDSNKQLKIFSGRTSRIDTLSRNLSDCSLDFTVSGGLIDVFSKNKNKQSKLNGFLKKAKSIYKKIKEENVINTSKKVKNIVFAQQFTSNEKRLLRIILYDIQKKEFTDRMYVLKNNYNTGSITKLIAGDFDRDGDDELLIVLFGTNLLLIDYVPETKEIKEFPFNDFVTGEIITLDKKDVNHDGIDEIIYATSEGEVSIKKYYFSGTGTTMNIYKKDFRKKLQAIAIGDINNDDEDEIVVFFKGSQQYKIETLTRTSLETPSLPMESDDEITAGLIDDIDGDGINELIIGTAKGRVIILKNLSE